MNKKTKKTNFSVTPKMAKLFGKFMLWYNEVSDEAKELADIASADETESGEVSLKYYTTDTDYIEISEGGIATASDGSTPADGEYTLVDGSVLVIKDGKFLETKPKEEAEEDNVEEAPVAEEKEGEDEDKKDEDEVAQEGEEKKDENVDKEDEKDEVTQEGEDIMPPYTLVSVLINGVEFQVPQEVADYIHTLEDGLAGAEEASENFRREIAHMKERMPSASPVQTVVKQSKETVEVSNDASSLIGRLNRVLK